MPILEPNRRDFVKLGGAALAVAATQTARSYAKIVGANDRVRRPVLNGALYIRIPNGNRLRNICHPTTGFYWVKMTDRGNEHHEFSSRPEGPRCP